jgi:hypothetical protein
MKYKAQVKILKWWSLKTLFVCLGLTAFPKLIQLHKPRQKQRKHQRLQLTVRGERRESIVQLLFKKVSIEG